ncbi:hypothetical protein GWI33_014581 [Rhynchophorus ferrugineus]|uniref:Tudor domain-containing protein n=1 Tax=Rhynchophorus ferrugineus TaxID=354439 RepID=A0A834I157_RHYFE|nr:hypothetical protein GWI33_014581 [Rhynchophorus ferrugineus]
MEDEDVCIPNSFVKNPWVVNNIYRLKVSYINSPSEFWIVTKDQELGKFHGDLNSFYSRNKSYLKADFRNINLEGNCVVYTGECYCRANLLNVSSSVKNQKSLDAFLIDYGSTIRVTSNDVYFLTKEMYSVPQFAVKAALKGLRPSESSTWSPAAVDTFTKLVQHKVLLGQLREIDSVYQTLYLDLFNYNDDYEHTVSISRRNKRQSEKIIQLTSFHDFGVVVSPHSTLTFCNGVITSSDLMNYDLEEILENMKAKPRSNSN